MFKKNIYTLAIITATIICIILWFWWQNTNSTQNLTAHYLSVPYVGIHNNHDRLRHPAESCDIGSSLVMLAEYWYPDTFEPDTLHEPYQHCFPYPIPKIIRTLFELEISDTQIMQAAYRQAGIDEIHSQIQNGNPVLTHLPLENGGSQASGYFPTAVIIGINPENEEIIVHSHWYGPNHRISFAKFTELQNQRGESDEFHHYFIEPKLADQPTQINQTTEPPTTPIITPTTQALLEDWATAEVFYWRGEFEESVEYYESVVANEDFTDFLHPLRQTQILYRMADAYRIPNNYEPALTYLAQGHERNHSLDQPANGFAGYDYLLSNNNPGYRDRISVGYFVEALVYSDIEPERVREPLESLLEINSNSTDARAWLESL